MRGSRIAACSPIQRFARPSSAQSASAGRTRTIQAGQEYFHQCPLRCPGTDETFRRARAEFETQLEDAIRATGSVFDDALARRRDRSFAVEPDITRLNRAAGASHSGLSAELRAAMVTRIEG